MSQQPKELSSLDPHIGCSTINAFFFFSAKEKVTSGLTTFPPFLFWVTSSLKKQQRRKSIWTFLTVLILNIFSIHALCFKQSENPLKSWFDFYFLTLPRYQWRLCEPHPQYDPSKAGVPAAAGKKGATDWCSKGEVHFQLFPPTLTFCILFIFWTSHVQIVLLPIYYSLTGRSFRFTREMQTFWSRNIEASWMNLQISSKSIRSNQHIWRDFTVRTSGIHLGTER